MFLPARMKNGTSRPAPCVDEEAHRREGFDRRIRRHARLGELALELTAHDIVFRQCRIARSTCTFSSIRSSAERPTGGSMASSNRMLRRWFSMTSRMQPTSS